MNPKSIKTIAAQAALPAYVRLPSGGQEHYSGLCRSFLSGVILPTEENGHNPPVRSICLRKPGRARGVRLIHLQSLLDWIRAQETSKSGKEVA